VLKGRHYIISIWRKEASEPRTEWSQKSHGKKKAGRLEFKPRPHHPKSVISSLNKRKERILDKHKRIAKQKMKSMILEYLQKVGDNVFTCIFHRRH
jgi:hypothetical protein